MRTLILYPLSIIGYQLHLRFIFFLLRKRGSFWGASFNSSPREARLLVKLSNRRLIS